MGNCWPNQEQTKLLQACLFSGSCAKKAWEDWAKQINFDKIDHASYKLLPLISRNVDLPEDPLFEKCKGVYRRTWAENHLHWNKILPFLTQANIGKIVLLKGMAMVLEYYRDFGVRVMGDIDILIAKEQLPIAYDLLSQAGWEQKYTRIDIHNPEHLSRWHALNFSHPSKMQLDVHWSFIEENCPALDRAVLKNARPYRGTSLYTPDPADLLLQACIHGVKPSPVPLIRWVADAVTLLKQEKSLNWDRLIELAKISSICLPVSLALQYLSQQFNAPIPQRVVEKLRAAPSIRLQYLEYRATQRGFIHLAGWHRFCLNRGHLTLSHQILQIPKYLQITARLKSPWQIPFYGVYWILKRLYRKGRSLLPRGQKKCTFLP